MKIINIILATILGIVTFIGCSERYKLIDSSTQPTEEVSLNSFSYEYKIQPNDRLSITSYKFPEVIPNSMNSQGIVVDSRGYINLPLIKRVKVAGLTQPQASKLLERRYSKYLKNPTFNVEAINKRAYVLGEVNKPGVIKIDKDRLNILEAIAFAGDLTDHAVRDNILVLSRVGNGKMKIRKVDLTNLDKLQSSNTMIKPDDIIYVQPNRWKELQVRSDNINSIVSVISSVTAPYLVIRDISN
jgi:polysaccharide export outer membrane protein